MRPRGPRLLLAASALLLAQCAVFRPGPDTFAFAVMGDVPYNAREETAFGQMIERIDGESLEFAVHVGDFTAGSCSDAIFQRRKAQFDRSAHPFIFTPGDNEWADCPRPADPLERLMSLRRIFFADDSTLGKRRFAVDSQRECVRGPEDSCACPRYVENRGWTVRRVRFVTLNFPGHDNNVGRGSAGDEEARCRNEANRRWLERALRESAAADVVALVVITQANPWFSSANPFAPFIAQLGEGAVALRKPVLFVHGDTHIYRVDQPFRDAAGQPIGTITRLETYGSPFVGWVKVEADPSRPEVFNFEPRLFAVTVP